MMQINGTVPANMAIDEITISENSYAHTLRHSLGKSPDMFVLVPKEMQSGIGQYHPYSYVGHTLSGGVTDYPYRLIMLYKGTTGTMDYTLSNRGWQRDAQTISVYGGSTAGWLEHLDYYLITYAYE